MAAKNLISSIAKALTRASEARGVAPTLRTQGLLSAPRGGLHSVLVRSHGQSRFMSTRGRSNMPGEMYGLVENPEEVFRRLRTEDKDVLYLVELMFNEVKRSNSEGVREMMLELKRISATQRSMDHFLSLQQMFLTSVLYLAYCSATDAKSQAVLVTENLAAHSGEIVSDLIEAGKFGINRPRIFGEGKPFEFQKRWLEKEVPEEAKKGGELQGKEAQNRKK